MLGSHTLTERLQMLDELVLAYQQAPTQRGLAGIAKLGPYYSRMSDSFGTNPHFSLPRCTSTRRWFTESSATEVW